MCFGGVCELHISPTNIVKQSLQHSFHILSRWLHGFIMVLYFSRCFGLKIHIFSRCLIWSACPWASSGTKTEKTKSGKILGFNLGHILFFRFFVSGGGNRCSFCTISSGQAFVFIFWSGRPQFLCSGGGGSVSVVSKQRVTHFFQMTKRILHCFKGNLPKDVPRCPQGISWPFKVQLLIEEYYCNIMHIMLYFLQKKSVCSKDNPIESYCNAAFS